MALTEKSRAALFQGLSNVVDEEAVEEMLSFFPARDVEEAVTKEFLRAELAEMELRMMTAFRSELRSGLDGLRSELRTELGSEIEGLRSEVKSEVGGLRSEVKSEIGGLRLEIREEIRRMIWLNVGTLVAFAGVIIAAVRL